MSSTSISTSALSCLLFLLPSLLFAQSNADRLTQEEDKQLKAMLDEVLKAVKALKKAP